MLVSVWGYKDRVAKAFDKTNNLPVEDSLLLREWAKYLSILVCSYLEQSIRLILMDYVDNRSNLFIRSYVFHELKYFQNPNVGKILELFGTFDRQWRSELEMFLIDEKRDAIDSLLNLRNNAAHGGQQNASVGTIRSYFKQVDSVLEFIYAMVNRS